MGEKREFKPSPGPWKDNGEDTGMNDSGTILDVIGHVVVTDVYGLGKQEAHDNAALIAAAPTMYRKLRDTVAWLDREIESREESLRGILVEVEISSLEELRDDLAETLRKIEEG